VWWYPAVCSSRAVVSISRCLAFMAELYRLVYILSNDVFGLEVRLSAGTIIESTSLEDPRCNPLALNPLPLVQRSFPWVH
jgi:hypothetical protein